MSDVEIVVELESSEHKGQRLIYGCLKVNGTAWWDAEGTSLEAVLLRLIKLMGNHIVRIEKSNQQEVG